MQPSNADPVLAYLSDGSPASWCFSAIHSTRRFCPSTRISVSRRARRRRVVERGATIDPPGFSAFRWRPSLARGFAEPRSALRGIHGPGQRDGPGFLVVQRSDDRGTTWNDADLPRADGDRAQQLVAPQLVMLAVDASEAVHAVYVGVSPTAQNVALFGDPHNRGDLPSVPRRWDDVGTGG